MVKRSYITDSLKWVGVLTLSLCLLGSGVLASDNSTDVTKSATKSLSSQVSAKTTSAGPISKVSNLELIYADGGVRLRVHTGSMTEFTHQIEPPKNGRPYRIILDCLNAHHNLGANSFRSLPSSVIQRIRTSQFAVKPQPITRIVLDLGKEAFYRVEQNPEYIDLFVTDRKAKRFNSWSSASWVAEKNAKAKAAKKSVKAPVAIATTVSKPKPAKSAAAKVESKKSETAIKSIVKVSSPLVAKVEPAAKVVTKPVVKTVKKTVAKPSSKPVAKSIAVIEKKPVAKKATAKPDSKPAVKSSLAQKPQVKLPVIAKAEVSKKSVAKVATQKVAVKKSSSQKSSSQVLASSKPAAAKSQVKATKNSAKVEKKAPVLAATKPTPSVDKKSVAKKSVAKRMVKKAPAKITAKAKSTLASKSSSKVEKPKAAKKVVKTTKTVKKSASNSSAKLASVAPSKVSKNTVSKSGISKSNASKKSASKKSIAKKSVAKKSLAKTANSKATLASKKSDKKAAKASEKKKAVDNSSSLFATTANAATPGQQTYKDTDKDRRYKAQFRRSIDQRKIKLKSTLVAEFPKRLTIKYKTHGSRDPFGTLLVEAGGDKDFMMKELPNVEALTMVGILRDVKGKTRGLFEDIDGRGYILSKGDKVRSGTVLKITKKKAYFQIFEYGWSRTVALSLEG